MRGPLHPTAASTARLWPPAEPFRFEGGFWASRQRVNSERSIPFGLSQLETHGQLDDLRRAAGRQDGPHTGRPYTDADVYKMAEALAWDGRPIGDLVPLIVQAQDKDGYLHTSAQCTGAPRFSDLQQGHEMYNAGHLIQAAVAQARALGETTMLSVATAFADHLNETFGPDGRPGICGHPGIEMALVELYRLTGHRRYLALAQRMIDLRGHGLLGDGPFGAAYYQDGIPIREAAELDGHCVRALYLAAGAADVYLETGDPSLLAALRRQWQHTVATKTYVTGGVGCRRRTEAFGAPYELPPDHAFNETCAGVANVMFSWRLLLATGDGKYADHIERVLFNVVAAGVSLDGDRFSYVNTLRRHARAMENGDKAPYRKPWFRCACCPTNVMRLLASLGHYVATTDREGVQIHQYASGTLRAGDLALTVHSGYPWGGAVHFHVDAAPAKERVISLRVPAWCHDATVHVNDIANPAERTTHGYVMVRRRWRAGDRLVLNLAMPPRLTWPDRRVDAVRGCVAIERGPLVYCIEDADLPAGVQLDAVSLEASSPLQAIPRPDLPDGAVAVEVVAHHHIAATSPGWPYRTGGEDLTRPASRIALTAIPYYAWDNRELGQMRVWIPEENSG